MSIEVRVPKEITEYKEKVVFGLSVRQLLSFIAALAVGVLSYLLLKNILGSDITTYFVILEVVPIFAFGFYKKDGMYFEKIVRLFIRHQFGRNKRPYATELNITKIEKESDNNAYSRRKIEESTAEDRIEKNIGTAETGASGKTKARKTGAERKMDTRAASKKEYDPKRECERFESTKADSERKVKECKYQIEAARKEWRRAIQANKKAISERESPIHRPENNQI